jgi:CheY-like chemotaxis protein
MRRKLLLADDSVTIQRVIELTFADEDVQVVAVGDGKKAIASIEADRPDIVLADVGMPERDGYEVAAFIKGNPQFASIPVLLLTGAFEPIDETRARAVGCDGVLVKPFEPQMVINRVKDLLAGRRPAGLWTASPTAHGPTRSAPPSFAASAPPLAPSTPGGSLEDYFDRLDAAFANLEGSAQDAAAASHADPPALEPLSPAAAARQAVAAPAPDRSWRDEANSRGSHGSSALPADVLSGWDPDLTGDPKKVEPLGAPVPPPAARPAAQVPATPLPELQPPFTAPSGPAPPTAASSVPAASIAPAPPTAVVPPADVAPAPAVPPPPSVAPTAVAPVPSPASVASPPPQAAPAAVVQEPVASELVSSTPAPSLAEAFAALLSVEQSRPISPPAFGWHGAPGLSDDALEDIVQRVIARMGEQAVRDTVVDVAERLVREEIDRIKGV